MRYSLCLVLLSVLIIPSICPAQWSSDPYENTMVAYSVHAHQMISDGAGGAIIVYWSSVYYGLRAQRLDKYGHICWGDSGIFVGGEADYQGANFDICESGDGYFFIGIVDIEIQSTEEFSKIYAQKMDTSGNKYWGDAGVVVCGVERNEAYLPKLAPDGFGGVFLTWTDNRSGIWNENWLYGQRLDTDGNPQWTENGICISGETGVSDLYNATISGGAGYALTFWHESIGGIFTQRLDIDGNLLWGVNGVHILAFAQFNQYISDDCGGCIYTTRFEIPYGDVFYAQRIDSTSNFLWGDSGIAVSEQSSQNSFRMPLTMNPDGIYTTWHDNHIGISEAYIQKINNDGALEWGSSGLPITSSDSVSTFPVITSSGSSDAIVIYLDQREGTIRAQKFDHSGNIQWDIGNVIVSYNNYLTDHCVISDMSGGAISCWTIYPAILYAQQISASGNLGEVLSAERENHDPIPSQITLFPNYPNPFNGGTIISFVLPPSVKSITQIGIYNQLGQQVANLIDKYYQPGYHSVEWNAESLPSGIYFARLETGEFNAVRKLLLVK